MYRMHSGARNVVPAGVGAPSDGRAPPLPPNLNATEEVAPNEPAARPKQLEPDPESITEVAQGNLLVKLAVALLVLLAVFALVLALG